MTEINSVGFLLAKAYQRACALYKEQFDAYDLPPSTACSASSGAH